MFADKGKYTKYNLLNYVENLEKIVPLKTS
jgi:hypothetical protein